MSEGGNPYQKALVIKWGLEYYYVPQSVWMKEKLAEPLKLEVQSLVERGAILAAVPSSGPTMGSSCYLVNLSRVTMYEPYTANKIIEVDEE